MATATLTTCDTRDRIIEAGTEIISEKGYHGCGLKEILDAAGVPKGSFYYYFKSKENFGVAVIEAFVSNYAQTLNEKFTDRSKPAIVRLRDHFLCAKIWYDENGYDKTCLVAKLGMDVAGMSPTMQAAMQCATDQWKAIFAKCLRESQAQGDINPTWDADELAAFILNAWEGVTVQTQIAQNTKAIENFVTMLFDHLIREF